MADDAELIKQAYGLQPGETLQDKWQRESRAERSRLLALSRDDLIREIEEYGVPPEMLDEIEDRMRR